MGRRDYGQGTRQVGAPGTARLDMQQGGADACSQRAGRWVGTAGRRGEHAPAGEALQAAPHLIVILVLIVVHLCRKRRAEQQQVARTLPQTLHAFKRGTSATTAAALLSPPSVAAPLPLPPTGNIIDEGRGLEALAPAALHLVVLQGQHSSSADGQAGQHCTCHATLTRTQCTMREASMLGSKL